MASALAPPGLGLAALKTFTFHQRPQPHTDGAVDAARVITVRVRELLDADFGLYVWPSAEALARHLANTADATCKGRVIVELGAGTGLAGLVCALCGATMVYLTDHAGKHRVLDNLHSVIGLNSVAEPRCVVGGLTWGALPNLMPLSGSCQPQPDLIIGADLFYDARNLDNILATVDAFFDRNDACVFLVAYQERGGTLDHLVVALAMWHMKANPVAFSPAHQGDNDGGGGSNSGSITDGNGDQGQRLVSTRLIEISRVVQ